MLGMSDVAAGPASPTADDPSALPSPASSPSSSQYIFLPGHLMPAHVSAVILYHCTFQGTVL